MEVETTRTRRQKILQVQAARAPNVKLDCPAPPPKLELPNYHSDGNDCTKHNPVKCYNCGMTGHFAASYPNNALFCAAGARMSILRTGAVEGMYVPDVVLDTGCTQTMV